MPAGTPSVIYQQQMMQYFFMLQQENLQLKMEQELLKEKLRENEEGHQKWRCQMAKEEEKLSLKWKGFRLRKANSKEVVQPKTGW
jgi:hypothetical protein